MILNEIVRLKINSLAQILNSNDRYWSFHKNVWIWMLYNEFERQKYEIERENLY